MKNIMRRISKKLNAFNRAFRGVMFSDNDYLSYITNGRFSDNLYQPITVLDCRNNLKNDFRLISSDLKFAINKVKAASKK
ncbi:MAG: hypothetical protein LBN95_00315 [Prevotellaceae bacterium]|jgi:hypothetical protein|nr:hypothetical protein [Prevotellaceae bacterium]